MSSKTGFGPRIAPTNTRSNARGVWSALALVAVAGTAFGQGAAPKGGKTTAPATTTPAAAPAPTNNSGAPAATPSFNPNAAPRNGGSVKTPIFAGSNQDTHTAPTQDAAPETNARVGDDMVVDLHVNDEDLGNVLQMLSIQSQRNIIASKNVQARVTANLYGVTFYEALDAILHANGYGYVEDGNFIYIYTTEELKAIEEASRVREAKVIRLNYLTGVDAAEFVKPLLSESGQIKTNGKTGSFPSLSDTPVAADDFANSATLVVVDYKENIEQVEAMLKELDTKPAQVLVEATVLQAAVTENNAFGVDFSLVGSMGFSDFVSLGGPLNAANVLIGGKRDTSGAPLPAGGPADRTASAVVSSPGNTSSPSTLKVGVVHDDLAVFLRVLDEVTDTTIISNPKVLALNRMPARVLVGRKVGYVSTTSTDTATTQTVQFLDTGTQLYFRPFVTDNGMVRMELKPQVSEADIRTVQSAQGQSITIPDEITNELTTNVLVQDGQTVVLGGLFRESTTSGRKQVPIFGDLPIIGAAFRGNEDEIKRSEIIFMVTPSIVNDQMLAKTGAEGMDYMNRVRTGARQGTLPFSRDRMTGMLNIEAEQLAAQGNVDGAMWKLRQSLYLNPSQPEAIALREKLTGQKKSGGSRSMLENIIRDSKGSKSSAANTTQDWQPAQSWTNTQPATAPAPQAEPFTQSNAEPAAEASASWDQSAWDNATPVTATPPANDTEVRITASSSTGDRTIEPNTPNSTPSNTQTNNQTNTTQANGNAPAGSTGGSFGGLRKFFGRPNTTGNSNSTYTGANQQPMENNNR